MSHHALLEYIRTAKEHGANDADISQRLHTAGWYHVDVQDALQLYARLTSIPGQTVQAYQSAPVPRNTLRHYDPRLIAVAVLSFAIGFIGYVWLAR